MSTDPEHLPTTRYCIGAGYDSKPGTLWMEAFAELARWGTEAQSLFCIFYFSVTTHRVHSYKNSLITFAEALLHIFMAAGSVGGTSLGCRAEIRTRACLTASQRTTS
jgi:hypothetical protein